MPSDFAGKEGCPCSGLLPAAACSCHAAARAPAPHSTTRQQQSNYTGPKPPGMQWLRCSKQGECATGQQACALTGQRAAPSEVQLSVRFVFIARRPSSAKGSPRRKSARQGDSQHVVGRVDGDCLREKADGFVELAGGKGVVALLLEFFSHTNVFLFLVSTPAGSTSKQRAASAA